MSDLIKSIEILDAFVRQADRLEEVQRRRNGRESEIMDSFFELFSGNMNIQDPTINKTTGTKHTVESMVEELKDRVGLEAVKGQKKIASPILARRAKYDPFKHPDMTEEDLKRELQEFARKYFLERDHGFSVVETIIEDFKLQPGGQELVQKFGREKIRKILHDIVEQYPKSDPSATLPAYEGGATPASDGSSVMQEKMNIGMGGSPGITVRL